MTMPTRAEAVAALLGLVVGAAEDIGESPVETLHIENGGRYALLALGVTPDELAAAEQEVAAL